MSAPAFAADFLTWFFRYSHQKLQKRRLRESRDTAFSRVLEEKAQHTTGLHEKTPRRGRGFLGPSLVLGFLEEKQGMARILEVALELWQELALQRLKQ